MDLTEFCWYFFVVSVIICIGVQYLLRRYHNNNTSAQLVTDPKFYAFQCNYWIIYWIVMFADWLQGPYVYALYREYNFTKEEIAVLFIAGFGSSAVFGTIAGSLADKFGRRRLSIYFGFIYGLSCLLKIFPSFKILLIGRLLAGIATSLLFSVFEAWMVHEHFKRNFPSELLGNTFSIATLGNGIAAILSGIIASMVSVNFGFVSPFIVALVFLLISSLLVFLTWTENYGDSDFSVKQVFRSAILSLREDWRIPVLGMNQSLFEASMYVFVFMWTPMLEEEFEDFNNSSLGLHGLTFANFMVMIMLGSSFFSYLEKKFQIEQIYFYTLLVSSITFFLIALVNYGPLYYGGFMVFEICVGLHFTCTGTLRSKYIKEEVRSTVMNLFRVPLNILVCLVLLTIKSLSNETVFLVCGIWLSLATIGEYILYRRVRVQINDLQ